MDSRERQSVSTTISTSLSRWRRETVAPKYPGTRRSSGRTLLEKCSRYLGNCASVVRADQQRKMVPASVSENAEAGDEVRIFAGESFDFAFVVHMENEQGAVDGIGERTGENEFAVFAGFAGEAQVFFAEGDAARNHIVDKFVEQGVVVHRLHLLR